MERHLINFYLDVVQLLIDRGVPVTVDSVNRHLAPADKEAEVVEALATLVAEGRLVKISTRVDQSEVEQYTLAR